MAVHLDTQVVVIAVAILVQTSHQPGPPHLTLHTVTEQQTLKMALHPLQPAVSQEPEKCHECVGVKILLTQSFYLEVAQYKQGVKLHITQSFIRKLLSTVWGTDCSGHELIIAA